MLKLVDDKKETDRMELSKPFSSQNTEMDVAEISKGLLGSAKIDIDDFLSDLYVAELA